MVVLTIVNGWLSFTVIRAAGALDNNNKAMPGAFSAQFACLWSKRWRYFAIAIAAAVAGPDENEVLHVVVPAQIRSDTNRLYVLFVVLASCCRCSCLEEIAACVADRKLTCSGPMNFSGAPPDHHSKNKLRPSSTRRPLLPPPLSLPVWSVLYKIQRVC